MKKALFYQTRGNAVECGLCGHHCLIKTGRRGICGVRENREGTLYSLVYGKLSAEHFDPVEKKPVFHFLPGTRTYSIATVGCNFKCLHCQNHSLSQVGRESVQISHVLRKPEEVVSAALSSGCQSISYTYSEPTIFFEFAYDCCVAAKESGLANIFVSNGFMSGKAAKMLVPVLDAINIDIKSFSQSFYSRVCGGMLERVLENVKFFRQQGVWVEVTTLLIPGLNDSDEEIRSIADFLVSIDPNIVWHVSGFRPTYKMVDRPPTSVVRLQSARQIGLESGLHYVYVGNVHGGGGEDTCCPDCRKQIITRAGFSVKNNSLIAGKCPFCSAAIAGVWTMV